MRATEIVSIQKNKINDFISQYIWDLKVEDESFCLETFFDYSKEDVLSHDILFLDRKKAYLSQDNYFYLDICFNCKKIGAHPICIDCQESLLGENFKNKSILNFEPIKLTEEDIEMVKEKFMESKGDE